MTQRWFVYIIKHNVSLVTCWVLYNNAFIFQVYILLDKLSSLHGLENRKELYKTHTKPVLDSFQDSYTVWSTHSVERLIFDVLIIEAGKIFFSQISTKMKKNVYIKYTFAIQQLITINKI